MFPSHSTFCYLFLSLNLISEPPSNSIKTEWSSGSLGFSFRTFDPGRVCYFPIWKVDCCYGKRLNGPSPLLSLLSLCLWMAHKVLMQRDCRLINTWTGGLGVILGLGIIQWSSTGLTLDALAMSSFAVTTSLGERRETSAIHWAEAKDAAKHSIMLKTAPHDNKEYPQMFIIAKTEKPRSKWSPFSKS